MMNKPTMCLLCPHFVSTWNEAYCEITDRNELIRVGLGTPSWCPLERTFSNMIVVGRECENPYDTD